MLLAVAVLSSCSSAPKYRSSSPDVTRSSPAPAGGTRSEIVEYAKTFLGTPYRNGGTTRAGVDCSGLVTNVYRHFSVTLPRMSLGQSRAGEPVTLSSVQPGDLVFFKTTSSKPVSHVGIYIGNGRFIHASTSARSVRIDELDSDYFSKRFVTARRVVD
jgi:cell wall-associated NlpC family hydrolase